jgi:hypothetical protein
MHYITVCDNCICRPVCNNKQYFDVLYECFIIRNEIRHLSHTVTSGHHNLNFRLALLKPDTYFIISKYQRGFIDIALRDSNAIHSHVTIIPNNELEIY